jgi:NADH-quinone oxidoreductase subunit N
VAVIALVTMALGNLGALVQRDLKRMLAYSGIAHAGTLLLVVAAGVALGDTGGGEQAAWYYMGAYTFTATGAFGLISLLEADGACFTNLDSLRGLARSRPGIAAAMSLFMLSLGGIPATGGFLGKWFVFAELVRANMIGVAVLGALFTVVALGYYLRVIVYLWMEPSPEGAALSSTQRPLTAGLATVFCCLGVLAMGLLPALFLDRMN